MNFFITILIGLFVFLPNLESKKAKNEKYSIVGSWKGQAYVRGNRKSIEDQFFVIFIATFNANSTYDLRPLKPEQQGILKAYMRKRKFNFKNYNLESTYNPKNIYT